MRNRLCASDQGCFGRQTCSPEVYAILFAFILLSVPLTGCAVLGYVACSSRPPLLAFRSSHFELLQDSSQLLYLAMPDISRPPRPLHLASPLSLYAHKRSKLSPHIPTPICDSSYSFPFLSISHIYHHNPKTTVPLPIHHIPVSICTLLIYVVVCYPS